MWMMAAAREASHHPHMRPPQPFCRTGAASMEYRQDIIDATYATHDAVAPP